MRIITGECSVLEFVHKKMQVLRPFKHYVLIKLMIRANHVNQLFCL